MSQDSLVAAESRWAARIASLPFPELLADPRVPEVLRSSRASLGQSDFAGNSLLSGLPLCFTSLALACDVASAGSLHDSEVKAWASRFRRRRGMSLLGRCCDAGRRRQLALAELFLMAGGLFSLGIPGRMFARVLRHDALGTDVVCDFFDRFVASDRVDWSLAHHPALSGFPWIGPSLDAGLCLRMIDLVLLLIADTLADLAPYDPAILSDSGAKLRSVRAVFLLTGGQPLDQASCNLLHQDTDAFLAKRATERSG